MSFDNMPDLGPFLRPDAKAYAESCIRLSREAVPRMRHRLDVPYGADFFQKLDIFLPDEPVAAPVPVLIFFHGGAWKNGFKEWFGFMAPPLVGLPAIFISPNYRLAPQVKLAAELEDCCDIVAWVRRNIAAFGGDPDRMFLGGHSAGGHLVALASLRPELLAARDVPAHAVRGCFLVSSAFDMQRKNADPSRLPLLDLLLAEGDSGAELSPINYVGGNRIPMHITYGSDDFPELIADNRRMIALLEREGCPLEHHLLEGKTHFDTSIQCGEPDGFWVKAVRRWMSAAPAAANTASAPAPRSAARH